MSNAIIIIDVETDDLREGVHKGINTKILSLLDNVRCPVIFSYYYHNTADKEWDENIVDEKIYIACKYSPVLYNNGNGFYEVKNRIVMDHRIKNHEDRAIKFLNSHSIKNLYFCGYSLPGCVFNRPLGIRNLKTLGFNCSAIIDVCVPGYIHHNELIYCSLIYKVNDST